MRQAACSTRRRAASISARLWAIQPWTVPFRPSGFPGDSSRRAARSHMRSKARWQMPIHRMQWWMRPGPSRAWAMAKPAPRSPSTICGRDAHSAVDDLRVGGPAGARLAHHRDVAHPLEARGVGGHQELAGAGVDVGVVGVGHHHHDGQRGPVGGGGEPLPAVDHPFLALEASGGGHPGRVGAGPLGLGHGEAAADPSPRPAAPARCDAAPGVPNSASISMLPTSGAWQWKA